MKGESNHNCHFLRGTPAYTYSAFLKENSEITGRNPQIPCRSGAAIKYIYSQGYFIFGIVKVAHLLRTTNDLSLPISICDVLFQEFRVAVSCRNTLRD